MPVIFLLFTRLHFVVVLRCGDGNDKVPDSPEVSQTESETHCNVEDRIRDPVGFHDVGIFGEQSVLLKTDDLHRQTLDGKIISIQWLKNKGFIIYFTLPFSIVKVIIAKTFIKVEIMVIFIFFFVFCCLLREG